MKLYQVNYVSFDESDSYLWTEFGTPTTDKKKAKADFKQTCKNTRGTIRDEKKEGNVEWYNETKSENKCEFEVMDNGSVEQIRIELVEFTIEED